MRPEGKNNSRDESVKHLFMFFLSSIPEGTDSAVVLRAALMLAAVEVAHGGCSEELVTSAQVLLASYSDFFYEYWKDNKQTKK